MSRGRKLTDTPLGEPFVADGEFWVIRTATDVYGPFRNEFVARQWALDADVSSAYLKRLLVPMGTVQA